MKTKKKRRAAKGKMKALCPTKPANDPQEPAIRPVCDHADVAVAESAAPEPEECPICRKDVELWGTWSRCGHSVCWVCAIRMAMQKKEKALHKCCYCQRTSRSVLIGGGKEGPPAKPRRVVVSSKQRNVVDCADEDTWARVKLLVRHTCRICSRWFDSYRALTAHTRGAHFVAPCDVCAENRPLFPKEQTLFTAWRLQAHMSTAEYDRSEVNHGHPICYLCNTYTYDSEALLTHVQSRHIACGLCTRTERVFFKNRPAFREHCRLKHAVCETCAATLGFEAAVYATQAALHAHRKRCTRRLPPHVGRQPIHYDDSTGLRLLVGPTGWSMEKPANWNSPNLKCGFRTLQWPPF
ncbi:E3 ubiquitin-protein ligase hel2 [Diplonema papillatum]|nr:E3 ubiquitin-protein ligase hel2 [Diplonema papillatum]